MRRSNFSRIRTSSSRAGARARDERGQALVIAMAIMVIGLLLGLAAVAFALNAGSQSNNDQQRREAQQASDAGIQQALYQQSNTNALQFSPGSGSVGNLLSCAESTLGVSAGLTAQSTLIQTALGVGGACPQQKCVQGTANCQSGTTPVWTSLADSDYYDAELCPNPEYQSSSGSPTAGCDPPASASNSSSLAVLFPEIVSVGCHSTAATCDTGSSANQYAKQLALLNPTAPLQAIEGENNVRVNNTTASSCSLLNVLGICIGATTSALSATIVDGNIIAGNALQLPNGTLGLSTTTAGNLVSNVVSGLAGVLALLGLPTNLTTTLQQDLGLATGQQPVSLTPTYEYGKCYGTTLTPASGVSSPSSSYTCGPAPTTLNGNAVKTGVNNVCTAGNPSTNCILSRPAFSLGASATATPYATLSPMFSTTLGTCATATSAQLAAGSAGNCYVNGDLSLTSGTLSLTPGTYVFCNVYVGPNAALQGPSGSSSGAVQIYILSPGSTQCKSNATGANNVEGTVCTNGTDTEGNFVVPGGVSDLLGGVVNPLLNGLTSTVDPSNFQIYVAGDTADTLTVDSNCQPRTQVTIGGSGLNAIQAYVIYAPRSNVSVTTSLSFEGSAIGWNVNLVALAIIQDLNLGNFPLSSVIDSYQTAQTLTCAPQTTSFVSKNADLNGC